MSKKTIELSFDKKLIIELISIHFSNLFYNTEYRNAFDKKNTNKSITERYIDCLKKYDNQFSLLVRNIIKDYNIYHLSNTSRDIPFREFERNILEVFMPIEFIHRMSEGERESNLYFIFKKIVNGCLEFCTKNINLIIDKRNETNCSRLKTRIVQTLFTLVNDYKKNIDEALKVSPKDDEMSRLKSKNSALEEEIMKLKNIISKLTDVIKEQKAIILTRDKMIDVPKTPIKADNPPLVPLVNSQKNIDNVVDYKSDIPYEDDTQTFIESHEEEEEEEIENTAAGPNMEQILQNIKKNNKN